jgi:hypothetical protein
LDLAHITKDQVDPQSIMRRGRATRTDLPLAAVDIISSFMDRLTTPDREEGEEKKERMRMQPEGFRANDKFSNPHKIREFAGSCPVIDLYGCRFMGGRFLPASSFLSFPSSRSQQQTLRFCRPVDF